MPLILKKPYMGPVPLARTTPIYTVGANVSAILKTINIGNTNQGAGHFCGVSTTVATAVPSGLFGVISDKDGVIYQHSPTQVFRITGDGSVTLVAGNMAAAHTDATGILAGFQDIRGLAIDSTSTNLYVADGNYIRKIVLATGAVTTIAGTGAGGTTDNATGTSATINPGAICIAPDDSALYQASATTNPLRKILLSGTNNVTTVLAGATAYPSASATQRVNGITITPDGLTLYYMDTTILRKVGTNGAGFASPTAPATTGYVLSMDPATTPSNPNPADLLVIGPAAAIGPELYRITTSATVGYPQSVNNSTGANVYGKEGPGNTYTVSTYDGGDSAIAATSITQPPSGAQIMSINIRNGWIVWMTDYGGTQAHMIWRMHISDQYAQRVAGSVGGNPTYPLTQYTGIPSKAFPGQTALVSLWIVSPTDAVPKDSNRVFQNIPVAPGEMLKLPMDENLPSGYMVFAECIAPCATISLSVGEG